VNDQPSPAPSETEQLRDSVSTLQTIVSRVRDAVGTDEPTPVRESYRIRELETRVSDAEYERDLARERAEQARAATERIRALHQPTGVVAAAEFGNPPDCTTCGAFRWPCPTIRALDEEPS
jgi:hypothetical protein